ncbi:hypothetical protein ACHAO8_011217 [Botrytis cinerea]
MAVQDQEPIAIIGMACRFPGGSNSPSKLWDLIKSPRNLSKRVPDERFNSEAFFHTNGSYHGATDSREAYFLEEDVALFDNAFFNIQPGEAEAVDPQQRLLMETVYDSLCAGGQTIEGLRGSNTGIYVGMMCDDWAQAINRDWESTMTYAATGQSRAIVSNRLSYFFDWHGPSMTVDTACSSSLVAVHQGVTSLRNGECPVVIAAGVNLILGPGMWIAESKLHMLSPTGTSKMWDESADGYARGEGIASVVMKRLSDALRDGDPIECVIRGTGVNQDGKTPGLTMPNGKAQADLIRDTYQRAGLDIHDPRDRPQFFHAHGTGTQAGDPQESQAIDSAFFSGPDKKLETMAVGSIKTIIGHTEGTAGLASLIGSVMAIKHGVFPPNLHFQNLSPKVAPFYNHLRIPTTATPWPELPSGVPRRISCNSFGFGGLNAHAIIESYESSTESTLIEQEATLASVFTPLTISAASASALKATLSDIRSYLEKSPDVNMHDLAHTLQSRRSTLAYRKDIMYSSREDAITKIDSLLSDDANAAANGLTSRYTDHPNARILGIFTGQGAQWPRMGAKLIEKSPFAARRMEELDLALSRLPENDRPSWTLQNELLAGAEKSRLSEATIAQPLCTAVQIILIDLLKEAGIKFSGVVGHSSGEIGAAYAAGFLSAPHALYIAYYRGFYAHFAGSESNVPGAMIAVGTSYEDALDFCELDDFVGRIQVAARNSATSITLSGDKDAVQEAEEIFKDEGKFARALKVDKAYHSFHMLPCIASYLAALAKCEITVQEGNGIQWYSSVRNGRVMSKDDISTHNYWVENMVNTVLFEPAVEAAASNGDPFDICIEVGPHPALKGPCLDTLKAATGKVVPYTGLLGRGKDDRVELALALGSIWRQLGASSVNFDTFESSVSGQFLPKRTLSGLPTYPFDHSRRFYSLTRFSGSFIYAQDAPHPLLGRRSVEIETDHQISWRQLLKPNEISWIQGHQLQGQAVFPAMGFVAMAIEAAKTVTGVDRELGLLTLENVIISRALTFSSDDAGIECRITMTITSNTKDEFRGQIACYSGVPYGSGAPLVLNFSTDVTVAFHTPMPNTLPASRLDEINLGYADEKRLYAQFTSLGYNYSTPFTGIRSISRKMNFATGEIEDEAGDDWEDQLLLHPGFLDSAIQTGFAAYAHPFDNRLWALHIPTDVRSIVINPYFLASRSESRNRSYTYQTATRTTPEAPMVVDMSIFSGLGEQTLQHPFIQFESVGVKPFAQATARDDAVIFSRMQYRLAEPDSSVALENIGEVWTEQDLPALLAAERLSFFHMRRLSEITTEFEFLESSSPYRNLLDNAMRLVKLVAAGNHPHVPREASADLIGEINSLTSIYRNHPFVKLAEVAGKHLEDEIRSGGSILEHMTKDNLLHKFQSKLALIAHKSMAAIVSQIAYRYPRMNILEIGAGSGEATQYVLSELDGAFETYAYTNVSDELFAKAQRRFDIYNDRMLFSKFDIDQPAIGQGFQEESFDLVLAAGSLSMTANPDDMMANVRRLLKPGGFLVVGDYANNDLMTLNLAMGSLPDWYNGLENDPSRSYGPCLTLDQWTALTSKHGFAGLDAVPFSNKVQPYSVFFCQAVDNRILNLREPLNEVYNESQNGSENESEVSAPTDDRAQLILVGGRKAATAKLVSEASALLSTRYKSITRVASLEILHADGITPGTTVLSLTELDEQYLEARSEVKLEALKTVWRNARTILHVTNGARNSSPYSGMVLGVSRVVRFEHPNINLQILDFDSTTKPTAKIIAESLARLELGRKWVTEDAAEDLHWSLEPELYYVNGKQLIPRCLPFKEGNERYNTYRRPIPVVVDPSEVSVVLEPSQGEQTFELGTVSPLRVLPIVQSTKSCTLQTKYSLMGAIKMNEAAWLSLLQGTDKETGHELIALIDNAAESRVVVPAEWTVRTPDDTSGSGLLATVAAYLVAKSILDSAPSFGSIIVHEANTLLRHALTRQAAVEGVQILFTTTKQQSTDKDSSIMMVHPNLPFSVLQRLVPRQTSFFVNMAGVNCTSAELLKRSLPNDTMIRLESDFIRPQPSVKSEHVTSDVIQKIGQDIKEAIHRVTISAQRGRKSKPTTIVAAIHGSKSQDEISLQNIQNSRVAYAALNIVNWQTSSVQALQRPIDHGLIFRDHVTYLLFGLAGELGQSLCSWMVLHGARHVLIASRNPKVDSQFINTLADEYGANVRVMSVDLTQRASLNACYKVITAEMPPVAGVTHGALVLADSLFDDMTFDDFDRTAKPKVDGTLLLDELFYDAPLDFFILFTSAVGVSGNTGQSAYIMANNFMTSLAAQRRDVRGVAGSDLALAAMAGLGRFERSEYLDKDHFAKMGYRDSSEQDFHRLFAEAVLAGRPENASQGCSQVASGLQPVRKTPKLQAQLREDPKFSHYILPDASALDRQGKGSQGGKTARARVRLATVKTRRQARAAVKEAFVDRLKRALMIPQDEALNEELTFVEQGVDSITAVEIRTWFLAEIEVDLPVLQILGAGTTVQTVVDKVMDKIPAIIVDWEKLINDDDDPVAVSVTNLVPPAPVAATVVKKSDEFPPKRTGGTNVTASTVDTGTHTPAVSDSTCNTSQDGLSEADNKVERKETKKHHEATKVQDVLVERQREQAIVESATDHTEQMTYGQRRMWYLTHFIDDPTTLNFAYIAKLNGHLQADHLARAVESVAQRHESLRTRFFWSDDGASTPMQSILSKPLVRLEMARIPKELALEAAEAELNAMRNFEWDLGGWVPVRLRLLTISDTEHYLLMGSHHITLDGHSFTIMMMDIEEAYLSPGQQIPALPQSSQARAFSEQTRLAYESGGFAKALDFYRRILPPQDFLHPIELFPFARTQVRPPQTWQSHVVQRVLDPSIVTALNQIARKRHSTSFHAYLASYQAMLFRLLPSNTTDKLFIGMADANRLDSKFLRSIGNFLNILPLRFDRATRQSFGDAIEFARAKTHTALEHSALPFELLLDELSVPRSNRWTPIFQVFIDYRLIPSQQGAKQREWAGCDVSEETWHTARSGFDVVLEIKEDQNETTLKFHVQKDLYDEAAAELLLNSYINVLRQVTEQGVRTDLTKLNKWDDKDVQKALTISRGPTMKQEWPATVAHQIAQVIQRHPNAPALKDGYGANLTYAAMNQRVEGIVSVLRAQLTATTKQEDQIVGVFQTPSADFVCSLLAIHRVGAVYLPLDPRNGMSRLASAVKAAQHIAILTDKEFVTQTNELDLAQGTVILNVADIKSNPVANESTLSVGPRDVAYMIFTSGSTGEPKGIVVRHENLRVNLEGFHRAWNIEDLGKVMLQNAAFSFDASLLQVFAPLTTGGCLVVAPADARGDPHEITNLMLEHGVTMTQATPSEYETWFRFAPENVRRCTAWKAAWFGGERAPPGLLHLFREACKVLPNLQVYTSYGPTEGTISAMKGKLEIEDPAVAVPVPGFVLPNYAAYIVDEALQPVPIGVSGEIMIGGNSIGSNEYWHRPDLTALAFLPDPFAAKADDGARMYRTGDLGQFDQQGRLAIKGRISGDTQVKIRGFRIELAEIEGVIIKEGAGFVTNAVVTLRGTDASAFLAAHITIDASKTTDPQQAGVVLNNLRAALTLCLPLYMCPSTIVVLEEMPLTAHSKVDRRAVQVLSLPELAESDSDAIIAPDLTWTERRLAILWATLLPPQSLLLTQQSSFFLAGGNSLLLVQLQAAITVEFGGAPRLSKLMAATTLASMAAELDNGLDTASDWDKEMALDLIHNQTITEPTTLVRRKSLAHGLSVLVTGATGHIGHRIINELASNSRVRRIICLVRPMDGRDTLNLFPDVVAQDKLHFLTNNLPTLPTDEEISDIDVVLHCAANRTFWDSYSAAKPINVDAVKALAQLCLRKGATLHVLSSGAVAAYEQESTDGNPDTKLPRPTSDDGYVSSKWVAERYLASTARLAGLQVTVHRPLQTPAASEQSINGPAIEAETTIVNSLIAAIPQLGVRPDFAHVDGWMDLAHLDNIVTSITTAVTDPAAEYSDMGLHIINYPGEMRVRISALAAGTKTMLESEVMKDLPVVSGLHFVGLAKRSGLFDLVVTAQEITVIDDQGRKIVSRR